MKYKYFCFLQVRPGGAAGPGVPRLHPPALWEAPPWRRLDWWRGRQSQLRHRLRQEEQLHRGRGQRCGHHGLEAGLRLLQHRQDSVSISCHGPHTRLYHNFIFISVKLNITEWFKSILWYGACKSLYDREFDPTYIVLAFSLILVCLMSHTDTKQPDRSVIEMLNWSFICLDDNCKLQVSGGLNCNEDEI